MRRVLVVVTLIVVLGLVAGLFRWMRSDSPVVESQRAVQPEAAESVRLPVASGNQPEAQVKPPTEGLVTSGEAAQSWVNPATGRSLEEYASFLKNTEGRYADVKDHLTQDDVAGLVKLLREPASVPLEPSYAQVRVSAIFALWYLDREGESYEALAEVIRGADRLSAGTNELSFDDINEMIAATSAMGLIRSAEGEALLRTMITEEGVHEIAQAWNRPGLTSPYRDNPDEFLAVLRGDAAQGLVFAGDPKDIAVVVEMHHKAETERREILRRKPSELDLTTVEQTQSQFYYGLTDAVVARDLIAESGLEKYLEDWSSGRNSERQTQAGLIYLARVRHGL